MNGRNRFLALATGLSLMAGVAIEPSVVSAQSTGNGIEESSTNTFRLDEQAGVVRVTVDITLRNVTTDVVDGNVIRQRYFDSYFVAVPLGAENIVITRNGQTLDGEFIPDPEFPAYSIVTFPLGFRLFSGNSTTVRVEYDHLGAEPRSEVPWRVNAAYAAFVAFGFGDDERVTINIVRPDGYEFDEFIELDGYDVGEPDENGAVTYTRTGVDGSFETFVGMSDDDALAVSELDVDGVDIELRSWPDDPEWTTFATERIEQGIPDLEALIGAPWPVAGSFDVIQTVEPNLYGYAGWFDEAANEIAVGEELDADLIYHELSHAWFNSELTDERWINEGFAQVLASEMVRRAGEDARVPEAPSSTDPGFRKLATWDSLEQPDDVEAFGYGASHWVMTALVDEIGFEATRDVLGAMFDDASPYERGASAVDRRNDWRRFYDVLVEVGGSETARALFEDHVVSRTDAAAFDARESTLADVELLVERAMPYELPNGIRALLERWDFDDADTAIIDAGAVLDLRDRVEELVDATGIDEPDLSAESFRNARRGSDDVVDFDAAIEPLETSIADGTTLVERIARIDEASETAGATPPPLDGIDEIDTFVAAIDEADDRIDALEQVGDVVNDEAATDGLIISIGRIGSDLDAHIDAARAAIVAGDSDAARAAADDARDALDELDEVGTRRATIIGAALGVLIMAVAAMLWRGRRRRRAARAATKSGGRLIGDDVAGGSGIDFEEDALTGAHLGGVDHGLDVTVGDLGEAP